MPNLVSCFFHDMLVDGWLICYRTQHYPKIELPHWFPSGQSPYRESLAYQLIEPGWNQYDHSYIDMQKTSLTLLICVLKPAHYLYIDDRL